MKIVWLLELQLLNWPFNVVEDSVVELFSWRHQQLIPTSVENIIKIKRAVFKFKSKHFTLSYLKSLNITLLKPQQLDKLAQFFHGAGIDYSVVEMLHKLPHEQFVQKFFVACTLLQPSGHVFACMFIPKLFSEMAGCF